MGGARGQTEEFRLIFLGDGKLLKAFELRVDMWGTFPSRLIHLAMVYNVEGGWELPHLSRMFTHLQAQWWEGYGCPS